MQNVTSISKICRSIASKARKNLFHINDPCTRSFTAGDVKVRYWVQSFATETVGVYCRCPETQGSLS
ncbi:hypothetical protein TSUD_96540 [Trifolium subterraneum]|nr:hypothetical protein TSUD_96540 [Trifolium subterraneum]